MPLSPALSPLVPRGERGKIRQRASDTAARIERNSPPAIQTSSRSTAMVGRCRLPTRAFRGERLVADGPQIAPRHLNPVRFPSPPLEERVGRGGLRGRSLPLSPRSFLARRE